MATLDQKVRNNLVGICRQIFVQDPGRDDVATIATGGHFQIWHTRGGLRRIRNLAHMLIMEDPEFGSLDLESLKTLIQEVLWELSDNHRFFDSFSALTGNARTLFEARKIQDVSDFSFRIWFVLKAEVLRRVTDWLILYPLPSTESKTFSPDQSVLTILETGDTASWSRLSSGFPSASPWSPQRGRGEHDYFDTENPPRVWVVTTATGLADCACMVAEQRFRELIALTISMIQSKIDYPFVKTIGEASRYCIQFPANPKGAAVGSIQKPVGRLIPWPGNKLVIDSDLAAKIRDWYARVSSFDIHARRRVQNAAVFLNLALQERGIQQFILYFMTLDALFGERNRVEESIQSGVAQFVVDDALTREKVKCLFDLRSELVHGGIHRIEEWVSLKHYWDHFDSEPTHDTERLAMESLVNFRRSDDLTQ